MASFESIWIRYIDVGNRFGHIRKQTLLLLNITGGMRHSHFINATKIKILSPVECHRYPKIGISLKLFPMSSKSFVPGTRTKILEKSGVKNCTDSELLSQKSISEPAKKRC